MSQRDESGRPDGGGLDAEEREGPTAPLPEVQGHGLEGPTQSVLVRLSTSFLQTPDFLPPDTSFCCMSECLTAHVSSRSGLTSLYSPPPAVPRMKPSFTIPPEPVYEVLPGESLNLTCVAVGWPMPQIRWREVSGS